MRIAWLVAGVVVWSSVARADDSRSQAVRFLEGRVERARRALSFGPTIGGFGGLVTRADEGEAGLSFGLGLYLYKIPILPDPSEIKELIQDRIKSMIADRIKAIIANGGSPPSKEETDRWALDLFEEVKQAILGEKMPRPRLVEKPRVVFDLEGVYLFRSGNGQVRFTAGYGIWKLSLGITMVLGFGDGAVFSLGPEIDLRLTPGKGLRSPVIDLYLRAEFPTHDRDFRGDFLTLGARLMLDLI